MNGLFMSNNGFPTVVDAFRAMGACAPQPVHGELSGYFSNLDITSGMNAWRQLPDPGVGAAYPDRRTGIGIAVGRIRSPDADSHGNMGYSRTGG